MRTFLLILAAGALAFAATAEAQEPVPLRTVEDPEPTLGDPGMTPDLWWRMKMLKEAKDPQTAVQAKAAARAAARRQRIAARKWYGMSNARPVVNTTPFFGDYSPRWVGHTQYPDRWTGYDYSPVTLRRDEDSLNR